MASREFVIGCNCYNELKEETEIVNFNIHYSSATDKLIINDVVIDLCEVGKIASVLNCIAELRGISIKHDVSKFLIKE